MENVEIIKQTILDLLKIMRFDVEVDVDSEEQNNIVAKIQTNEAGFLIGQSGANLEALQHLARILVNKKIKSDSIDGSIKFILDVNNYKEHRAELLKELAVNIATQALSEKRSVLLEPMPAFERRIIHMVLAGNSEIQTESTGEEPMRRIIIKPR